MAFQPRTRGPLVEQSTILWWLEGVAVYIVLGKLNYKSNQFNDVLTPECRATVHPLVLGLPGSVFRGFRSYEGAYWDYYTSKQQGKVKVVRGPFDDFIFGPISKACM